MKVKISVCLFIFFLLFSAAFFLQQKNHREFYIHEIEANNDRMEIIPLSVQVTDAPQKLDEPFKSREYVRIGDSR